MAGNTNFPTGLDDDSSLYDVTDAVSTLQAAHHNNLKEAVKAIEAKVGVHLTSSPTALDYRIGHPTGGHIHNGASGQGPQIAFSDLAGASGAGSLFQNHPTFAQRLIPINPTSRQIGHASSTFHVDFNATTGAGNKAMISYANATNGDRDLNIYFWDSAARSQLFLDANFSYLELQPDYVAFGAGPTSMMELFVNDWTAGGLYNSKFFYWGGWGIVPPALATSAIHATYSEESQMYWDSANNKLKVYDGATWRSVAFE